MRLLILAVALALPATASHAYEVFAGYGVTEYSGTLTTTCGSDWCPPEITEDQELTLSFAYSLRSYWDPYLYDGMYSTIVDVRNVSATIDGYALDMPAMRHQNSNVGSDSVTLFHRDACKTAQRQCDEFGWTPYPGADEYGQVSGGIDSIVATYSPSTVLYSVFGPQVDYEEYIDFTADGVDVWGTRSGTLYRTGGEFTQVPVPPAFALLGAVVAAAGFFMRRRS